MRLYYAALSDSLTDVERPLHTVSLALRPAVTAACAAAAAAMAAAWAAQPAGITPARPSPWASSLRPRRRHSGAHDSTARATLASAAELPSPRRAGTPARRGSCGARTSSSLSSNACSCAAASAVAIDAAVGALDARACGLRSRAVDDVDADTGVGGVARSAARRCGRPRREHAGLECSCTVAGGGHDCCAPPLQRSSQRVARKTRRRPARPRTS